MFGSTFTCLSGSCDGAAAGRSDSKVDMLTADGRDLPVWWSGTVRHFAAMNGGSAAEPVVSSPPTDRNYRPEAVIHDPAFYLSNSSICARRFLRACSVAEGLLPSVAPFFTQLAMLSGASGPRMLGILT